MLLRESWLEDMMSVLTESVVPSSDVHAVDAATKRHEAITADVMARVGIDVINISAWNYSLGIYYLVSRNLQTNDLLYLWMVCDGKRTTLTIFLCAWYPLIP